MILCDGFLPIYSPKLGENIGHLKITVAMGSAIQVNRMIAKETEEEARRRADLERIRIIEAERAKELESTPRRTQDKLKNHQESKKKARKLHSTAPSKNL